MATHRQGDFAARWQAECERAVLNASEVLRLAGRAQAASAVLEIIRTAPRRPLAPEDVVPEALFARCAVFAAARGGASRGHVDELLDYFAVYLPSMSPSRRALLEASVAGVIIGWGMGG